MLDSGTSSAAFDRDRSSLRRRLFRILAAAALIYAFCAGLRTIKDYDLGWQLATGRWVVQHHHAPPVEAFSYIAQGNWIYPVGAGLIFYAAYLIGGFALLSWIGALACCGTVLLLLRRGRALTAALAIVAVPIIAWRTAPRADLFSVVIFAAFLSLLWENYQTGRARLWLLPLLMVAWVNLHLGFAAGLAMIAWYVGAELLEAISDPKRRVAAMARLRRAWVWLGCTALATLVNPWGWDVYRALIRQQRVTALHATFFGEWQSLPIGVNAFRSVLLLRDPAGAVYVLLAVATVAGAIALLQGRLAIGALLFGAMVPAVHYIRMEALFACVAVVVGGDVLTGSVAQAASWIKQPKARAALAAGLTALLVALVGVRCFDLVSNRYYLGTIEESTFGAGLGWWFPQRAADFIEREKLPSEVFNTYTQGGYLSWRLAPERRDYIDGRGIPFGTDRIEREIQLRQSPPDSPIWQQEISRYNINTVLLPVARYQGYQFIRLPDFCNSPNWSLVYMDEVSAIFVRRSPQTEQLIQRFPLSCATAPVPPQPPTGSRADRFNARANSAGVLSALGRNAEAMTAIDNALAIFPQSAWLHWLRGNLLFDQGRFDESDKDYLAAIEISPSQSTWDSLAGSYRKRGRILAAIDAEENAARYSSTPWSSLSKVGYLYLDERKPENALAAFDRAANSMRWNRKGDDSEQAEFMIAQGRSRAWQALGETEKAIAFQEQAAALEPTNPDPWRQLANLYRRAGRMQDAAQSSARAASLEAGQSH